MKGIGVMAKVNAAESLEVEVQKRLRTLKRNWSWLARRVRSKPDALQSQVRSDSLDTATYIALCDALSWEPRLKRRRTQQSEVKAVASNRRRSIERRRTFFPKLAAVFDVDSDPIPLVAMRVSAARLRSNDYGPVYDIVLVERTNEPESV